MVGARSARPHLRVGSASSRNGVGKSSVITNCFSFGEGSNYIFSLGMMASRRLQCARYGRFWALFVVAGAAATAAAEPPLAGASIEAAAPAAAVRALAVGPLNVLVRSAASTAAAAGPLPAAKMVAASR